MGATIKGANATHEVELVSGEKLKLLSSDEQSWWNATRDKYLAETKFTETTDLRDVDRLLSLELMVYRWTVWMAQDVDYDGDVIDAEKLQRNLKLYSDQITKVKDSMGLSKKARDEKERAGDFSTYLTNLKARAKEFGIHREKQLDKALQLMNELLAIVGAYDRSDDEERKKIGFETEADIVDWIRSTADPEYRAIDAHFRANQQKYWVREL